MTITNVAFSVPGEPQGKGRARIGKIAGHARMFTPSKTVAYEGLIAHAAASSMGGHPPLEGALVVQVDMHHSIPASWSARKKAKALAGDLLPTVKPDIDNVLKAVGDGGNGVVWQDDRQIVQVTMNKRYSLSPGLHVRVGRGSLDAPG